MEESRLRSIAPWAIVSTVLGVVALVVAVQRFDALPDPYPTHFGSSGAADAFGDKTWGTVLLPVIIGQVSALVVFAIALAAPGGGHRIRTPFAAMGACIGGGTSVMAIAQYLADDAEAPGWFLWAFLALLLLATVWLLVAAARAGSTTGEGDDRHWKWGLVYINPDDPDVFVPKRIGTGVTLNLGRPLGWLVLLLVLIPGALIITAVIVWT